MRGGRGGGGVCGLKLTARVSSHVCTQIRGAASAIVDTATGTSALPSSFAIDLVTCDSCATFDLLVTGAGMLHGGMLSARCGRETPWAQHV